MTFILKQSTAGQDIVIGSFVDDTDFKSTEPGLTIANTDIKLMKDGAASVNKNSGGGTHRINGMYSITLDATDTGTVGQLMISVDVAGALPVWLECMVIEETVYDLFYAPSATGQVVLQGVTHTSAVIPTVSVLSGHTAQTADHTAGIADIPTVSEFNARTQPTADYFDPAADTVVNVTNVATLTGHTVQTADHTAGIADIPTVSEFNARTIPTANYFDPAADTVVNVTNVATLTGHTVQTADHTAAIADIPTVSEFNDRTRLDADYFSWATDPVAVVTLCDTTTVNSDMRGTDNVSGAALTGTATSGSTTTCADTVNLTQADTDYWKGSYIRFTSGNISGQVRLITDFTPGSDLITFAPAVTQTVAAQDFEILPAGDIDLVNTVTTNTDMVGTNNALLAADINLTAGALDVVTTVTNAVTVGTMNTDVIDAASIATSAMDGKGNWNIGKTGYTSTLSAAGVDLIWDEPMVAHSTADTSGLLMNDWQDGGRLDVILDARMAEASIDTTGGAVDTVTAVTNAVTVGTMNANVINAASIATNAMDNKGNWNIGKTGYSLTQSFPTNFADLNITVTTGDVSVDALAGNVITAASINANALDGKGDWNINKTGYALSTAGDQSVADLILPPTNIAYPDIEFLWVAASDHVTPVTGASTTSVERSIDGGAFGSGTGTLTEVSDGIYQYDASAADMNGKIITFKFTATGGTPGAPDDAFVTLVTSK